MENKTILLIVAIGLIVFAVFGNFGGGGGGGGGGLTGKRVSCEVTVRNPYFFPMVIHDYECTSRNTVTCAFQSTVKPLDIFVDEAELRLVAGGRSTQQAISVPEPAYFGDNTATFSISMCVSNDVSTGQLIVFNENGVQQDSEDITF